MINSAQNDNGEVNPKRCFLNVSIFVFSSLFFTFVIFRCHTIRDAILTCARKPTRVSLIYRTWQIKLAYVSIRAHVNKVYRTSQIITNEVYCQQRRNAEIIHRRLPGPCRTDMDCPSSRCCWSDQESAFHDAPPLLSYRHTALYLHPTLSSNKTVSTAASLT